MKKNYKNIFLIFFSFLTFCAFSQDLPESEIQISADKENGIQIQLGIKNQENQNENETALPAQNLAENEDSEKSSGKSSGSGSENESLIEPENQPEKFDSSIQVSIPKAKRPKSPDSEKIKDLDNTDPDGRKNNPDIIKYGLEDDVSELLETLTKNQDLRFANEIYDLFQETKSNLLREKILRYFRVLEDPCLEDFAVFVLDDPYDEKKSIVDACFSYVQAVKTKEACAACKKLLESDDEEYFMNSIETLGKIGGAEEAQYLAKYLENEDLTLSQRQTLVRSLGNLYALETFDTLVSLAEDEDENSFVRMYSAEAIGEMKKKDAIPVLVNLFESDDPNLRASVIKGLSNFNDDEAKKIIIQGIKDSYQKVRKESIDAVEKLKMTQADEYLIYRAKNDKESSVKKACYETLASLGTQKGDEYLFDELKNKKTGDNTKLEISKALLKNQKGFKEIASLAQETIEDTRRKQLRYALGKEMAKYSNSDFAEVCLKFIESKDNATAGTGLDIYAKGRYSNCDETVKNLAEKADLNAKSKNQLAIKAAKILGMDVEKMTEAKDAEREAQEKLKNEKNAPQSNSKNASASENAK